MIATLADYVRNIAVFLIFSGFVTLLAPEGRYKSLVRLVLGFILVLILVNPIVKLMGGDFAEIMAELGLRRDMGLITLEGEYYGEEQKARVLRAYKENLTVQLERLLLGFQGFSLYEARFTVGEGEGDFGEIKEIWAEMTRGEEKTAGRPLIWVEPVTIPGASPGNAGNSGEEGFSEEIKKMEKAISDFYNVTSSNIHIVIRDGK